MQNLNLICPIGFTGYGITSLNIYKQLKKQNINTILFPMGQVSVDTQEDRDMILEDLNKQVSFSTKDPCFKIWHQFDLATRVGNGQYSALTFFETDRLKPLEITMINNLDYVFVASKWAKDILINNGINIPIYVSPLGVDPEIFNQEVTKNNESEKLKDKYVFLNVGKWEIRKGHDVLLEAFNNAFSIEDNVELWMVNHNPFLSQEENGMWINLYKNSSLGSKIKILPRVPTHKDLAKLISTCDCGVFPARAEGWNNEVPEFYALDKPVILTNYSAHTEYANKDNSYLVDIDELVPAIDNKFFDGHGNWADLGDRQQEQLVEHMRYVYKNNIRTNPGGLNTAKLLTWNNTAKIIQHHIYG